MKSHFLTPLLTLILVLALPGPLRGAPPREQDPPLFNGSDLAGWTSTDPAIWSVEGGAIVGSSKKNIPHNVFLWSPVPVKDFLLTVEVKLTPDDRNAGIQFRSVVHPTNPKEALGYQADVGKGVWGCLYHESGRQVLDWRGLAKDAVKPGEWNRYEILAIGDRIWGALNGVLTFAIREPAGEREGKIALQVHAGPAQEVRYRTLKLIHDPKATLAGMNEAQLHAAAVLLNKERPSIRENEAAKRTSGLKARSAEPAVDILKVADWPQRVAAHDEGSKDAAWAKADLDDRGWKLMTLPAHWESAGLPDYDGVVWFRRTITAPTAMVKGEATLNLGAIDDMDVTWVNGVRVGGHEQAGHHYTPRRYKLPPGLLKPGKNVIAVRVLDHGWGGGIAQTHGKMELSGGGKSLPLVGPWRYRKGADLAALTGNTTPNASSVRPAPFGERFELRPAEVVAFAGGTGMMRQVEHGYLETILTDSIDGPLFFRDIAWQADTVYQQQRPRSFGTQIEFLNRLNATVVLANFGQMESLEGVTRLPDFITAYEKVLDEYSARTPRIVLITPHPFEPPPTAHLPDLAIRNGDVAAYAEAIRQLAERRGMICVDLSTFDPSGKTADGVQLTKDGHKEWAAAVASQLLHAGRVFEPSHAPLRKAIQSKNLLWRRHWRPTNWSFLYGNRQHVPSSKDHRPGQPRWFPAEINAIIPLIESEERNIQSLRERSR